MNIEERVKQHVGDLQRRIKARILPNGGQTVRQATSQQGTSVLIERFSFPSRAWLTPSNPGSP